VLRDQGLPERRIRRHGSRLSASLGGVTPLTRSPVLQENHRITNRNPVASGRDLAVMDHINVNILYTF